MDFLGGHYLYEPLCVRLCVCPSMCVFVITFCLWVLYVPPCLCILCVPLCSCVSFVPLIVCAFCLPQPPVRAFHLSPLCLCISGTLGHQVNGTLGHWDTGRGEPNRGYKEPNPIILYLVRITEAE